jgi:hypothetical protein
MKTLSFDISDEAFDLLNNIHDFGVAEYRDIQYKSIEDFKLSLEYSNGFMSTDSFLKRNFGGTYYLIPELLEFGLVDIDNMCWHTTYILTNFGKYIISKED